MGRARLVPLPLIAFVVLSLTPLYGGPSTEGPNTRFYDYPAEIVQYDPGIIRNVIYEKKIRYENITHDLYLLYKEYVGGHYNYVSATVCLNISLNRDKELLFLELFDLGNYAGDIAHSTNRIVINNASINYYNQRSSRYYNINMVFDFDENNLLVSSSLVNNKNEVLEAYYYVYNEDARLASIIAEQNDGTKLLRKAFYYDGVLRHIPRPFFHDIVVPNTDEIIIFDDSSIKYHLKTTRRIGDGHTHEPGTLKAKEEAWFFRLFEYNSNGDEVRQTEFRNESETSYLSSYIEYDSSNNWLRKAYTSADNQPIFQVTRDIKY